MIDTIINAGKVTLNIKNAVLDRANAPELRDAASAAVDAETLGVVIDCSSLQFIDSSGVGALLHVNNILAERCRPVRLVGVSGGVLSVLELVRVHGLFELETK